MISHTSTYEYVYKEQCRILTRGTIPLDCLSGFLRTVVKDHSGDESLSLLLGSLTTKTHHKPAHQLYC